MQQDKSGNELLRIGLCLEKCWATNVAGNEYYDDLLEQNSLIYQNWKVKFHFQWAYKLTSWSDEL